MNSEDADLRAVLKFIRDLIAKNFILDHRVGTSQFFPHESHNGRDLSSFSFRL
jgi:hypothetical protein